MNGEILTDATAILAAYLIGSFPPAYIIGRIGKGIDIRQVGSRNMGAMNVFYSIGFAEGLLALTSDIGKGAAAVALARWMGTGFVMELMAGIAVVIGHSYPVFLKFQGGRGGATCIGILAYLMPWGIPIYTAIFATALLITRYPTLSYSLALLCFPLTGWLVYHKWELSVYTIGLLLLPILKYIPRIKQMHIKGGSWRHVLLRRDLKDRL